MARRSPQGQKRFERSQLDRDAIETLTQAEYQSLRMMAQGHAGKLKRRQNFASRGLISSTVTSRMIITAKGYRSLEAYIAQDTRAKSDAKRTVRPPSKNPEVEREKWLRRNAPAFRRAAP